MHGGPSMTNNSFLFPEYRIKIDLVAQDGVELFLFNSKVKVSYISNFEFGSNI
jgi:hypothetical protein